ncbi:MAG: Hypothetical protein BHV28_07770 [Candidatus Tokpelaia hoelldobleri]|uniref:DUF177 domain-containing protein n=1 Tax=Candidatus Tokpelaia hoelldobleri TaxID=1902579 RepID=A0A1U9JUC3_9HYPH|nr:MAG: Hypothetical protein BHV28_07770 [Candidatus Tokpelaia hoelldoblerii]
MKKPASPMNEPLMEFALSFPVDVRSLPPKGTHITLQANRQECDKLARNHGLLAVARFSAEFDLRPWKKRGVRLKGEVAAQITQQCVVTLEPVENSLVCPVDAIYLPDDSRLAGRDSEHNHELLLDAEGADAPEVFSGNRLDAGAVAEEFFELSLDPYPRKAGAHFGALEGEEREDASDDGRKSPFAVLDRLKRS